MKETKNRFDFIQTDKRVIERNLRSHLLTPAEHQKYLKSLQDEKDHWEEIPVSSDKGESNPS